MTGTRGPRTRIKRQPAETPARETVAPPLPDGYDARTVAWWAGILALPHAADFQAAEWQLALRGAFVLEQAWQHPSAALLTEVRRIEAALGVTRGDRERLGIREGIRELSPPMKAKRPDPRLDRERHEEELARRVRDVGR